jgi:sarcosine oxidase/L-pipecolate oxidase
MSSSPESVIIVGAGVFGLSTALAIARRHPSTKVTIVDRLTPPVEDGSSVDTTRCIRADYSDVVYARLAAKSQRLIEADEGLKPHYYKQGMSFIWDGKPGPTTDFILNGIESVKKEQGASAVEYMNTPQEVFQRIHGQDAQMVPCKALKKDRTWNKGYNNTGAAFIDAKESIRVYYERCLTKPSIKFECGVAVDRLSRCSKSGRATGVFLEDGRKLTADLVVVAAGAWSNKLVYLEGSMLSSAIEVAWIKLTDEEIKKWKNMSITTNMSTGFNLFPPHNGEMKCLRRSAGYRNTVKVPHPEDSSKNIAISYPRTSVTNPGDSIPAAAEASLRDDLRELMPSLADRPFARTKLCW